MQCCCAAGRDVTQCSVVVPVGRDVTQCSVVVPAGRDVIRRPSESLPSQPQISQF